MNTIVDVKRISFKDVEQKVFKYICRFGCEITQIILEAYDNTLEDGVRNDKVAMKC